MEGRGSSGHGGGGATAHGGPFSLAWQVSLCILKHLPPTPPPLCRWLKYSVSPRANIFRRDQSCALGLTEMKQLLRSNKYKKDAVRGEGGGEEGVLLPGSCTLTHAM